MIEAFIHIGSVVLGGVIVILTIDIGCWIVGGDSVLEMLFYELKHKILDIKRSDDELEAGGTKVGGII